MKSTYIFGFILLGVVLCLQSVLSLRYSAADDKSYLESPYTARDLASWLMEVSQRNDHSHKRNSEIINSLLGVPKLMNDAGRK